MGRIIGKLGSRLFYSILISSIIIVLLSILSAFGIRKALDENIKGQRELDSIGDTAILVYESLIDQETGLRGYIITKDATFLDPYNKGVKNYIEYSKLLIEKSKNYPKIHKEVNEFIRNGEEWQNNYATKSFEKISKNEIPSLEFMYQGKKINDDFREHSETLTQLIEDERAIVRNLMQKRINFTLVALVTLTIFVMFLNVIFYYNILKSVIKPLIKLSECVKSYTAHHFKIQVPKYKKDDELKDLIDNVDIMRAELAKSIGNLETKAMIDDLTNLYNRRYFNEIYGQVWEIAKQNNQHLSLLLFDIDHYKIYNDTYGHLKGDDCLKEISKYLVTLNDPPNQYVARFGGE